MKRMPFKRKGAPLRLLDPYRYGGGNSGGGGGATDPYFDNVVLLMHCDGADGSSTFVDSSKYARVLTSASNARIRTSAFKFGSASMGAVDNLSAFGGQATAADAPELKFGTGDFTVEAWVNFIREPVGALAFVGKDSQTGGSDGRWMFGAGPGDGSKLAFYINGSPALLSGTGVIGSFSNFIHLAVSRQSGTLRMFRGGQLVATGTDNTDLSTSQLMEVGLLFGPNDIQYIDEVRVTKGVARYTSSFAPPTTAFPDQGNGITSVTWDPAKKGGDITLSSGNLVAVTNQSDEQVWATLSRSSGKYYFENQTHGSSFSVGAIGFTDGLDMTGLAQRLGLDGHSFSMNNSGTLLPGSINTSVHWYTDGDVTMNAIDLDAGKIWFGVNGVWVNGIPGSGPADLTFTPKAMKPALTPGQGPQTNSSYTARFTATSMQYQPAGFLAWDGTNGVFNFGWNPADISSNANTYIALSNSNKTVSTIASGSAGIRASQSANSGKRYFEVTATSADNSFMVGSVQTTPALVGDWSSSAVTGHVYRGDGPIYKMNSNGLALAGTGAPISSGDVIQISVDFDNLTLSISKSGTVQSQNISISAGTYAPVFYSNGGVNEVATLNTAGPFAYTPPSGFVAWAS